MKSRTIFILRTIGDFLILFLVIILCGELHKKLPVRNPAIWCNDESIKYPYKVDTISNLTLIVTTILVPFLVIIISQIILRPRPRLGSSWNRTFFHWPCVNQISTVPMGHIFTQITFVEIPTKSLFAKLKCHSSLATLRWPCMGQLP